MKLIEKIKNIDLKKIFVGEKETELNIFDNEENLSSLSKEEISATSKILHKNDTIAYDKTQNAMCYVVLGAILTFIGILFIFLSLKKRINKIVGINYNSLQFYICIIALVLGISALIFGIIKFVLAFKRRKKYHYQIALLGKLDRN